MRVDQVQNRNEVCIRGIRLWHAMHCCYALYDQTVFEAITRANFCSLSNDGFEVIICSAMQATFNRVNNTGGVVNLKKCMLLRLNQRGVTIAIIKECKIFWIDVKTSSFYKS